MFKNRLANHKKYFKHEIYKNETSLSTHIWKIKGKNHNYVLKWKLIDKGHIYDSSTEICNLCNKEKYHIINNPERATLNIKNELWRDCIHKSRLLLCNYRKGKPP